MKIKPSEPKKKPAPRPATKQKPIPKPSPKTMIAKQNTKIKSC